MINYIVSKWTHYGMVRVASASTLQSAIEQARALSGEPHLGFNQFAPFWWLTSTWSYNGPPFSIKIEHD